jgi:hypothetical protein
MPTKTAIQVMEDFREEVWLSSSKSNSPQHPFGEGGCSPEVMEKRRELWKQVCPTGAEAVLCKLRGPYKARAKPDVPGLVMESVHDWLSRVTPTMASDYRNRKEGSAMARLAVGSLAKILAALEVDEWQWSSSHVWQNLLSSTDGNQFLRKVLKRVPRAIQVDEQEEEDQDSEMMVMQEQYELMDKREAIKVWVSRLLQKLDV